MPLLQHRCLQCRPHTAAYLQRQLGTDQIDGVCSQLQDMIDIHKIALICIVETPAVQAFIQLCKRFIAVDIALPKRMDQELAVDLFRIDDLVESYPHDLPVLTESDILTAVFLQTDLCCIERFRQMLFSFTLQNESECIDLVAVIRIFDMPDQTTTVVLQGMQRIKLKHILDFDPYLIGTADLFPEVLPPTRSKEFKAIVDSCKDAAIKYVKLSDNIQPDAAFALKNISNGLFCTHN